jgi:hypothetical protein
LDKLQATTKQQVLATLEEYFLPLFDSSSSVASIVTGPGNADEIASNLSQLGFDVKQRTLDVGADDMSDISDAEYESGSEMGSER